MKARRAAGATHSFRLSRTAADMIDRLPPFVSLEGKPYPRSLGGKSKLVADAIVWCYGSKADAESYNELMESRRFWMARAEDAEAALNSLPLMGGRRSILTRIVQWIRR
jgi:hypothetical protein